MEALEKPKLPERLLATPGNRGNPAQAHPFAHELAQTSAEQRKAAQMLEPVLSKMPSVSLAESDSLAQSDMDSIQIHKIGCKRCRKIGQLARIKDQSSK
jgi:hypothetical protein